MLLDMQGTGFTFYDPEIASSTQKEDGEYLFCAGNLSKYAMETFISSHKCNVYCTKVGLKELKQEDN